MLLVRLVLVFPHMLVLGALQWICGAMKSRWRDSPI